MEPSELANENARLDQVREQFEQWRQSREKRGSIPDTLWEAAASLHPQYSLHQISKALRLNHTKFRQRVLGHKDEPCGAPVFIDVGLSQSSISECTVEIAHPNGAKIRMQLKGPNGLELINHARQFWP
jgi:hypothetical protein